MSIVRKVQMLCSENNITLTSLERELEFSKSSISRWESNSPSVDKVIKVAQYFKVSADYLLGLSEYKNNIERDSHNKILDGINDTFDDMPMSVKKRFSNIFYELLRGYDFSRCNNEITVMYLDLILSLSIGAGVSVGIISSLFEFYKDNENKLLGEDMLETFLYEFSSNLEFISQKTREFEQKAMPLALSLFPPDVAFNANNHDNLTAIRRLEKFKRNMTSEQ